MLHKICPSTTSVTYGKLNWRIKTIINSLSKMTTDEAIAFLRQAYNFDVVSPTLEALGLSMLHLNDTILYTNKHKHIITHQVVVELEHFRTSWKKDRGFVRKWIRALSNVIFSCSDSTFERKNQSVVSTYKSLKKKTSRIAELNSFLLQDFSVCVVVPFYPLYRQIYRQLQRFHQLHCCKHPQLLVNRQHHLMFYHQHPM